MDNKEYKDLLKKFHKHSDRHILVLETDMPYSDVQKVVALSDSIRKAGNELVAKPLKNQLWISIAGFFVGHWNRLLVPRCWTL